MSAPVAKPVGAGEAGLMGELALVLREATSALSRLDAEELEALEARAQTLRDAIGAGLGAGPGAGLETRLTAGPRSNLAAELTARFRVYAQVVAATGNNLAILQRVGGARGFAGDEGGARWVR